MAAQRNPLQNWRWDKFVGTPASDKIPKKLDSQETDQLQTAGNELPHAANWAQMRETGEVQSILPQFRNARNRQGARKVESGMLAKGEL